MNRSYSLGICVLAVIGLCVLYSESLNSSAGSSNLDELKDVRTEGGPALVAEGNSPESRRVTQKTQTQRQRVEERREAPKRPRVSKLTPDQRRDVVESCLRVRLERVLEQFRGLKYQKLLAKIPADCPNYAMLQSLALKVDQANIAYTVEKESAIVDAFSTGVGLIREKRTAEPGVYGRLHWGAPPGRLWGPSGSEVLVHYSLPYRGRPRLRKAKRDLRELQKRFDRILASSR